MQQRENYLYVGMELHKETHTAVLVNCWNEKLDVIVIENKPCEFSKLEKRVNKKAIQLGLSPIYGLENAYGYGRALAVWLIEKGQVVKKIILHWLTTSANLRPHFRKMMNMTLMSLPQF